MDQSSSSRTKQDLPDEPAVLGAFEARSASEASTVLSAEQVHVSTVHRPLQRVRIRKERVTEEVTVRATVHREVLRVDYEPIDPLDPAGAVAPPDALGSADAGRVPLVIVLSQEEPVLSVRVVAYEQVSIGVRAVASREVLATTASREVAEVPTDPPTDSSNDVPTEVSSDVPTDLPTDHPALPPTASTPPPTTVRQAHGEVPPAA